MGNINISDLRPAGADLFLDSESYLNDLTEGEMINTLAAGNTLWWGNNNFNSNGICITNGGGNSNGICITNKGQWDADPAGGIWGLRHY